MDFKQFREQLLADGLFPFAAGWETKDKIIVVCNTVSDIQLSEMGLDCDESSAYVTMHKDTGKITYNPIPDLDLIDKPQNVFA